MRRELLPLLAEQALAAGRPLHAELRAALAGAPPLKAAAQAADDAEAGRLEPALRRLGVDPLVAAIARTRPEAAAETGRRLRRLPTAIDLLWHVRFVTGWFLALSILVGMTGFLFVRYVEPIFLHLYAQSRSAVPLAGLPTLAAYGALAVGLLVFAFALLDNPFHLLDRLLLPQLREARALVAVGALVAGGASLSDAVSALPESDRPRVPAAGLDERALDAAGHALARRAEQRMAAWRRGLVTGCTLALLLCASGIAAGAYVRLPQLAATALPPGGLP